MGQKVGGTVAQWLALLPVPVWVLSGFSGFLPQSKDVQHNRLIDYSKLAVGVRVSGFLSPCVCDDGLVQGVPCLSPNVSWDRLFIACLQKVVHS